MITPSRIRGASNPPDSVCWHVLTYRRRLLPSKKQHIALADICESQRELYNGALEHRIGAWTTARKTITLFTQQKELTQLRQDPAFRKVPMNAQRWTLRRLDAAYQAFFRRVKTKGEKAGFPRFRGCARWQSFGFAEFCGIRLRSNRLYFKGMPGGLRIHLHRPLPAGKPLCCTFTRDNKGWFICLQYRVQQRILASTGGHIGIDVGLKELCVLSTGEAIPNPQIAKRADRELRRRHRALARCKKGSKRRAKVKRRLSRLHAKVVDTRRTYLHQISARLVMGNDVIAVEKLNVKGLASGMLAKSVHDAGWGMLKEMLTYKAAKAGRKLIEVDPKNTTQACSSCNAIVPKKLSERWHHCHECGLSLDRDHNAALNVLHRAVERPGLGNVGQWAERSAGNIVCAAPQRDFTKGFP